MFCWEYRVKASTCICGDVYNQGGVHMVSIYRRPMYLQTYVFDYRLWCWVSADVCVSTDVWESRCVLTGAKRTQLQTPTTWRPQKLLFGRGARWELASIQSAPECLESRSGVVVGSGELTVSRARHVEKMILRKKIRVVLDRRGARNADAWARGQALFHKMQHTDKFRRRVSARVRDSIESPLMQRGEQMKKKSL